MNPLALGSVLLIATAQPPPALVPADPQEFVEIFLDEAPQRAEIVVLAPATDGSTDDALGMWASPAVRSFAAEYRFAIHLIPDDNRTMPWRRMLDIEGAPTVLFRRSDGQIIQAPMDYFESPERIKRWLGECRSGRSRIDILQAAVASKTLNFGAREELRRELTKLGRPFEADMLIGDILVNIDGAAAVLSPDDPHATVRRAIADIVRIRAEHDLIARSIRANPNRPQDPTHFDSWIEEHDWHTQFARSGFMSERDAVCFSFREVVRELNRRRVAIGLTPAEQSVLRALTAEGDEPQQLLPARTPEPGPT